MDTFIEVVDELIAEDLEIMDELIEEEIMPLIKYKVERDRKLFEKAYQEVKKLEEEL